MNIVLTESAIQEDIHFAGMAGKIYAREWWHKNEEGQYMTVTLGESKRRNPAPKLRVKHEGENIIVEGVPSK